MRGLIIGAGVMLGSIVAAGLVVIVTYSVTGGVFVP